MPATVELGERSHALLSLQGIDKRFFGVHALREVNLEVRAAEVHALLGENGAGKSTLIKIIAGAEQPDQGQIFIDGQPAVIHGTRDAFQLGVATVYQEPQIFPDLSVTENIFLGRERRDKLGNVDRSAEQARVAQLLADLHLDPRMARRRMADLSLAEQQLVLICKALAQQARLIIYDEPTAILTQSETDTLFGVVRHLKARGVTTLYISHRLEEVFEIADRVTIMKDGRIVATRDRSQLTIGDVVELMAGRKLHALEPREAPQDSPVVLRVTGLTRAGHFQDVSFEVGRGEIVGFFGLIGSGASEIALAIYGVERPDAGRVELDGQGLHVRKPMDAVRRGIVLLPKDRKTQGLFLPLGIDFNIAAGNYRLLAPLRTFITRTREREVARKQMRSLAVKAPGPATRAGALSGGNQQKTLLARLLVGRPKVLILDEPTRGVDVDAKNEIHRLIFQLAESGTAVIVISSELPEALKLADRLIVIRSGRIRSVHRRGEVDSTKVLGQAIGDSGNGNGAGGHA